MLCKSLEDRLTDPPHRVGDELEAACLIESAGCFDQTEIAFIDQVAQGKTLILILLCDRYNEAQIGLDQDLQRSLSFTRVLRTFVLDPFCQINFHLGVQQVHLADLLEVHIQ